MNKTDWLDTATKKIRFRPDRKAVRRELEAHLEDLREASWLEEDAALAAMGDPAEIAEELSRVHRPWLGYLWRMSQIALVGALAAYCLVTVLLASRSIWQLPGMKLYDYLTWQLWESTAAFTEWEPPSDASVKAGGYTIQVDRAALREREGQRELHLAVHINTGWRGEALRWFFAIREVRDSSGNTYTYSGTENTLLTAESAAVWGLGQKAGISLYNIPEDMEWAEIDLGYGELRRTLHIDLPKEAGT